MSLPNYWSGRVKSSLLSRHLTSQSHGGNILPEQVPGSAAPNKRVLWQGLSENTINCSIIREREKGGGIHTLVFWVISSSSIQWASESFLQNPSSPRQGELIYLCRCLQANSSRNLGDYNSCRSDRSLWQMPSLATAPPCHQLVGVWPRDPPIKPAYKRGFFYLQFNQGDTKRDRWPFCKRNACWFLDWYISNEYCQVMTTTWNHCPTMCIQGQRVSTDVRKIYKKQSD